MKESEFIELLNLYLDHEISAADSARLEAEVQKSPERRKLYQTYCRMQKACKVLAADFKTDEAAIAAQTEKKVVAFNPAAASVAADQRKRSRDVYAVGGFLAAAACLAFIFVNRHGTAPASQGEAVVQASSTPAVNTAVEPVATVAASSQATTRSGIVRASDLRQAQPSFVSDPLLLSNAPASAILTAARQDADNQLEWIQKLQITPLQVRTSVEDMRFDTRPAALQPVARTLGGNRTTPEQEAELVAWRIRR